VGLLLCSCRYKGLGLKAAAALPLIALPKFARNWSGFQPRGNHAGHKIGVALIADAHGVFLPGLTVEIEVKAPIVTAQCLIQFSLRQRTGKLREIVYQLEVCPRGKRSHNGLTPIYGPHEHIGDDEPTGIPDLVVDCENWEGSFGWFLSRVKLNPFELINDAELHLGD
jgi:hypothetical protein